MRKKVWSVFISGLLLLLLAGGFYFGLAEYYADGFSYGTWINGIYCTGKSVQEVNTELLGQFQAENFTLTIEDVTEEIPLEEIAYTLDYEESLQLFKERQDPKLWILNAGGSGRETEIKPAASYDKEKLSETVKNLPAVKEQTQISAGRVEMVKTKEGYRLINEKEHVLDETKLLEIVEAALQAGSFEAAAGEECYVNLPLTNDEQETLRLWEKVEAFQDCKIRYDLGDEILPVDASVVCDWISLDEEGSFRFDENGELIADEQKIKEFVDALADEYDTVGTERAFATTRGETVKVSGGTYGNKLDREAETAYLTENFQKKADETHVPSYLQEAAVHGKDDIGSTYIEIDMTEQMMYYYVDGEIYVQTSVVTGNTGRRMGTPEGVCYVYNKQTNRILRGENYASFVNFWVPVRGNIGIHDAPWRSEYGGEIYKTNGSHGCINTPYEEMEKLYNHVEIGTPVVMFY